MSNKSLELWLQERTPKIPEAFRPGLEVDPSETADVEGLLSRGLDSLDQALGLPGRNRDTAFHLLAADAFITYACEAATGGGNVLGDLEGVLDGIGAHYR
jgi:hypothetical protein